MLQMYSHTADTHIVNYILLLNEHCKLLHIASHSPRLAGLVLLRVDLDGNQIEINYAE